MDKEICHSNDGLWKVKAKYRVKIFTLLVSLPKMLRLLLISSIIKLYPELMFWKKIFPPFITDWNFNIYWNWYCKYPFDIFKLNNVQYFSKKKYGKSQAIVESFAIEQHCPILLKSNIYIVDTYLKWNSHLPQKLLLSTSMIALQKWRKMLFVSS